MNTKKNYYIELLRFVFCLIILLHHSGLVSADGGGMLPSGGVIADAFFMLTGYFACANLVKNAGSIDKPFMYSVKYTYGKIKRVFPYAAFGTAIIYFLEVIHIREFYISDIARRLYYFVVELLLLPMTGIMKTDLLNYRNAPLWFISAMMIALPIVMYASLKIKAVFSKFIVWVLPIAIQIWMVVRFGGALPWMDKVGFVCSGLIRGISSIMMGFGIYYVSKALAKRCSSDGEKKSIMLTITELVLLAIVMVWIVTGIGGYMEVVALYLIAISLTLTLSGVTYTSKLQVPAFASLGALSMPVYCTHWGVYRWVGTYIHMGVWVGIAVTFFICVMASMVIKRIIR